MLLLYSDTISSFLALLKKYARDIITQEMGLVFNRNRFKYKEFTVPLKLVVFEQKKLLGFFNPLLYQIGIHKMLMYSVKTPLLKNILRHELAHLFCKLKFGELVDINDHGSEFKTICRSFGWGPEVSNASIDILNENEKIEGEIIQEKLLPKIKKLMQLAQSSNVFESEQATIKANQLLLKHNLSKLGSSELNEEEIVYVKTIPIGGRKTAKYSAIYTILKKFFVQPIFNYGEGIVYLDIIGNKSNVELAEYITAFLATELERLWQVAQRSQPSLKGATKKNSFMNGIAAGFCKKISITQNELAPANALIELEKNLANQFRRVYPRSSSSYSKSKFCKNAHEIGKDLGKKLTINPAVKANHTTHLLTF